MATPQSKETLCSTRTLLWVSLLAAVYCSVWFLYYAATPLGQSPALDNQQTLLLAQQIAEQTLPAEPFHRAPLYPYILSLALSAGLSFELLPLFARFLNICAVLICTITITATSIRLWKNPLAGWISGIGIGLNPVLIFFAGDPYDILPATACLCLALHRLLSWREQPNLKNTLLIALYLSLGAALRSHLLPLALCWPLVSALLSKKHKAQHLAVSLTPVAFSFLLLGIANQQISGDFRMTPWQGAYNLWAGNGPQASGKIYTQQVRVKMGDTYDNPAKLESIKLYELQTDNQAPHSIDEMNTFWVEKTFDHIMAQPADWLALMGRKAYYYLNNYEQYDNKTYGLHKGLHWPLKWNPIHWGALLVLAVSGALIGLRSPTNRPLVILLIATFALYAAGTILFYTPNRFRVPMLPILCLLCGGATQLKHTWLNTGKLWKCCLLICIPLSASITYSNFFKTKDTRTWEEDYALFSNASIRLENDSAAIQWAQKCLALNPQRTDMRDNIVQANFNQWAFAETPEMLTAPQAHARLQEINAYTSDNDGIQIIKGIYKWKLGEHDEAQQTWSHLESNEPFAYFCQYWTGRTDAPSQTNLDLYQGKKGFTLLKTAVELRNGTQSHSLNELFNNLFAPAN